MKEQKNGASEKRHQITHEEENKRQKLKRN